MNAFGNPLLKFILLALLGCFCAVLSSAYDETQSGCIRVEVNGFRNAQGCVFAALYNGAEGFPALETCVVKRARSVIKDGRAILVFDDIPYGTYAIALVHDENDSGAMDQNIFGFPLEGWGFSNDAEGMIGLPDFTEASFRLQSSVINLQINLKYFF